MAKATVELEVRVKGVDGLESLKRMVAAAAVVLDIVDTVEHRCQAVDGPVTPTLRAMREAELRKLWKACRTIASTQLPQLEWRAALDPRTDHLARPGAGPLPPFEAPLPRLESKRVRVARVLRRRKARRKST